MAVCHISTDGNRKYEINWNSQVCFVRCIIKFIVFVIWFWITSLIILFLVGWTLVVSSLIMNPSLAENATFGIFDTLG